MSNTFNVASSSFVTGIPLSQGSGWVVVSMDDIAVQGIEHSAILEYSQGSFKSKCLRMYRTRHVAWLPGLEQAVFVGDNGECTSIAIDGYEEDEYVTSSARNPRNTGHIRAATSLGDELIVVGMQRQVYRRTGSNTWIDMMQGIPSSDPAGTTGFECILAISGNEIYAAGWRGEIWLYEGVFWRRIDSPTNQIITSMCLAPDGNVLACGRNGLILKGRNDSWLVANESVCPEDLWSIVESFGIIFSAGLRRMYTVVENHAELVDFSKIGKVSSFGELISNGEILWSMGQKDFLSFNGTNWSRIS